MKRVGLNGGHGSYLGFADLTSDGKPMVLSTNHLVKRQLTPQHSAFSPFFGSSLRLGQVFPSERYNHKDRMPMLIGADPLRGL